MILSLLGFLFSLAILLAGADLLVRGAALTAQKLGIPPLVAGLTIVAFGTSAPELVVNVFSALKGNSEIALSNILGSNIANILLVLGLSASLSRLKIQENTIWKDIPFALLSLLILLAMSHDKYLDKTEDTLSRTDGLSLIGFFTIFVYYSVSLARREFFSSSRGRVDSPLLISLSFLLIGLLGLFWGGDSVVDQAVELARKAGISETFIGFTAVAVGTSLPELATSVVAALRQQADIAVGNVIGSNIFNVFWILGITSVIQPLRVPPHIQSDIWFCLASTFVLFLVVLTGRRDQIGPKGALLLLFLYVGYLVYLFWREAL
ncbi:MAG: calcium/sodium antiporter [Leptospiraceae bacterium]|nr:calcium/sodium antiporter [Leptospiraceae bacterium]MDW8306636.1 calcium/sodium antiporter [Leptospiraceae bacterium]